MLFHVRRAARWPLALVFGAFLLGGLAILML